MVIYLDPETDKKKGCWRCTNGTGRCPHDPPGSITNDHPLFDLIRICKERGEDIWEIEENVDSPRTCDESVEYILKRTKVITREEFIARLI